MKTDLRLLQTFIEAARAGNFSTAARSLHISPAAVSQNIKSLEDHLGVRLFTRTTRNVVLTPEGERFFARCTPALGALDDAVRLAADEAERIEGVIRLTSTTAFGRSHVIPALKTFLEAHPGVAVEIELSDRFVDLVAEQYDFAIRAGILPDNEYVSRKLIDVTPMVCASPTYFDAHGRPERLSDIARHRCVGMLSNPTQRVFQWEFRQGGHVVRKDVAPVVTVNDPEALAVAAVSGLGLAQLGSNLALPRIGCGDLELILERYQVPTRGIYAVYPTRRYMPLRAKALIDHIVSAVKR
ncbi:MAG: LysR family transcriptional regulator [Pseudomonadota bacterium]